MPAYEFKVEVSTSDELSNDELRDSITDHLNSLRPRVLAVEVWDVVQG